MGPCASSNPPRPHTTLPLTFKSQPPSQNTAKSHENEFIFKLTNVCVVPIRSNKVKLTFSIDEIADIRFDKEQMTTSVYTHPELTDEVDRYELKWTVDNSGQFTLNEEELCQRDLVVKMAYDGKDEIDIIRISLYLIVNGPYHHNLQIALGKELFRVLFDAKISHIFEANLGVEEFKVSTPSRVNVNSWRFAIKAMHQDEEIENSDPSYDLLSSTNPIFEEEASLEHIEATRGSLLKLHANSLTEEQKAHEISWSKAETDQEKTMPCLTFDISALDVTKYSIQLIVWSSSDPENTQQNTQNYVCETRFPVWKMFDKEFAEHSLRNSGSNKINQNVDHRHVRLKQKLYHHQDVFGSCDISLQFITDKLIEQTKYCSRTEQGIVNKRPAAVNKSIKSNSKTIHELWKIAEQIDHILEKASDRNYFQTVQSQIMAILTRLSNKLIASMNQVLYADINKNEALINNQNILIGMLQKIFPFIENTESPFVSEVCWAIIISVLKRNQFSLENLSLRGSYATQEAKGVLVKKKDVGLRYQETLYKLIYFGLKGYGLYQNANCMVSSFLALVFFRVPLFRLFFFAVIEFEDNYSKMEKTLMDIQKEIEPKTSFSSNFAQLKGDWQTNFFDELKDLPKSLQLSKQLQGNFRSKKWFMQMSYRDENMYDFISLLLDSLSKDSDQRADKWRYIQGYCQIVAIVMSEMKVREIAVNNQKGSDNKYTQGLYRLSIELLENEHLISQMLPLVCDKIRVFEWEKTQMVLVLVDQYLEMVTKKKTMHLPTTFSQNYFFKLIKAIFEAEHFQNMGKLLLILHKFFEFFSQEGKYQIVMYLMGKMFFKLYYHWSAQIRNNFYVVLLIKIKHIKHQKANDIIAKYNKVMKITKIIENVHANLTKPQRSIPEKDLFKKLKNGLRDKFKSGDGSVTTKVKNEYALENIMKAVNQPDNFGLTDHCLNHDSWSGNVPRKLNSISNESSHNLVIVKHWRSFQSLDRDQLPPGGLGAENPGLCRSAVIGSAESSSEVEPKDKDKDRDWGNLLPTLKKRRPSITIEHGLAESSKYSSKLSNQLHQLTELREQEIRHVTPARTQMEQVEQEIKRYEQSHGGALPPDDLLLAREVTSKSIV